MSEAITVHRLSSPLGDWEMALGTPTLALRPFVQGMYTGSVERLPAPLRRLELPHPGVVCIFDFGDGYRVRDARTTAACASRPLGSFVAGLYDSWVHVDAAGTSRCVQVNLTPLGAMRILGLPLGELVNRSVPMESLPGASDLRLSDCLDDAGTWEARFAAVEAVLLARVAGARALPPLVESAWRQLHAEGGAIDVATLARSLGCSRRHLGTLLQAHTGLSPKMLARLIRFDAAVTLLARMAARGAANGTAQRLSSIAHRCRYYDHAHMDRDFREFAGMSPSSYLSLRHPRFGALLVGD